MFCQTKDGQVKYKYKENLLNFLKIVSQNSSVEKKEGSLCIQRAI